MSYQTYINDISEDINNCLNDMGTQPILFVGSGLSQRYFNGPSWVGLLEVLQQRCPNIPNEVGFYIQDGYSYEEIGSEFTKYYREWAWANKGHFPEELFNANVPRDAYIKYEIKRLFEEITPNGVDEIQSEGHRREIEIFRDIQPHAIITTNYDTFLEKIYPDYQPIVGQRILKPDTMSIGEIFKIHGCVSDIKELVLHKKDYEMFLSKKKYLSAKLLTFFAEHPLVFVGYSGQDENIQAILSDIDEIISMEGELIPNIYFLEFNRNLNDNSNPRREKVLSINKKEIRVKYIEANSYEWVLKAFSANKAVENVHPKLLRALLARTYKLVRSDIPRRSIEVNFELIEKVIGQEEGLPKLYGVSLLDDPSQFNLQFPYTITQLGKILGYQGWHGAANLISQIYREKGFNLKGTDNKYHVTIKLGKSEMNKYSQEAVKLLTKVKNGEEYSVENQLQNQT